MIDKMPFGKMDSAARRIPIMKKEYENPNIEVYVTEEKADILLASDVDMNFADLLGENLLN